MAAKYIFRSNNLEFRLKPRTDNTFAKSQIIMIHIEYNCRNPNKIYKP